MTLLTSKEAEEEVLEEVEEIEATEEIEVDTIKAEDLTNSEKRSCE